MLVSTSLVACGEVDDDDGEHVIVQDALDVDDSGVVTYDRMACINTTTGSPLSRYNYDQAPLLTGGTLERQGSRAWSLTTLASGGRTPRVKAGRSELRYGDPPVFGGPRAELAVVGSSQSRYRAGDDRYYGMSVRIPSGWVDDGGIEDIIFQWNGPADAGEAAHSPDIVPWN